MYDRFTWPGFDKANDFSFHKVINEPDFLPLFFLRHLAQAGKILHKHKDHLRLTPAGQRMLEHHNLPSLQVVLFHITFWHLDLGYLSRDLHHGWPQRDAGIVLWSLSIAANDWQPHERLTRLCTVPINAVLETSWDTASFAMEAQILRPLQSFGLLEYRGEKTDSSRFETRHLYRKSPLFDRFLSFDVRLAEPGAPRH